MAYFGVAEAGLAMAASDGCLDGPLEGPLEDLSDADIKEKGNTCTRALGAMSRHWWGCMTQVPCKRGHACVWGGGSSNSAVVLLPGFARKHLELDQDVLVRIYEWGKGRTMLHLEAK